MRFSKWIVLALALLLTALPSLAEGLEIDEESTVPEVGEIAFSEPVDEPVGEIKNADLWTEDIAKAAEEAEERAVAADTDFQIEDGTLVKYNGPGGFVAIPSTVTSIGKEAFYKRLDVTGVTIPDSVTSIGVRAFSGSGIVDVTVPASVEKLGALAFYNCRKLESITLAGGIATMGEYAFQDCRALTCLTIKEGVKALGHDAFWDCRALTNVTIPASITSFGNAVFHECTSLTSVTFNQGAEDIPYEMFKECTSLSSVTIPNSVTDIGGCAFEGCTGLCNISIPGSVKNIWGEAFSGCTSLSAVTLGNGVETIEAGSFSGCRSLAEITLPASVRKVSNMAFSFCSLRKITIESNDITFASSAFNFCPSELTFYTHCETPATLWAREHGYAVVTTEHNTVELPAVPPTLTSVGLTAGSYCSACGTVFVEQQEIPMLIDIAKCEIDAIPNKTYTGKAIMPRPVIRYGGVKLVLDTDYTVSYKNNTKVGKATVTIEGTGKYGSSAKKTFKINPKGTALSKVTPGKKKLTVTWKKQTKQVSGYQIQYGTKKDFSNAKKVTVSGAKTVKKVIKSLKAKKYYYVRVRTYKTVSGKKYYSSWSKSKKIKTK